MLDDILQDCSCCTATHKPKFTPFYLLSSQPSHSAVLPSHYLHILFFSAVPNSFYLCQVPSYSAPVKLQTLSRAFLHWSHSWLLSLWCLGSLCLCFSLWIWELFCFSWCMDPGPDILLNSVGCLLLGRCSGGYNCSWRKQHPWCCKGLERLMCISSNRKLILC